VIVRAIELGKKNIKFGYVKSEEFVDEVGNN
jgi:hypothetical protein